MPFRGRGFFAVALLLSLSGCHGCWDDEDDDPPVLPPAPPTNLAVTLVTSGRVALSWSDMSSNETGFLIERSPDGLAWAVVGAVAPNVTSHVDRGLLPLTQYFYRVSATGNGGSTAAGPVGATTLSLAWDATTIGGGPSARFEHSAIYDAPNRRMILFGGDDFILDPIAPTTHNNDVWALDLSIAAPAWSPLAPGGAAPFLAYHAAIYDSANKRMIVFGGIEGVGGFPVNGVWALTLPDDGVSVPTWSPLAPAPDPIRGFPTERFNHTAVYDESNSRMIVFGGSVLGAQASIRDAWALTLPAGGGTPAWSALADGPEDRAGHTAVYDPDGLRMLVFAGNDGFLPSNSVFQLSLPVGAAPPTWSTRLPASASPPGPRFEHSAVLDRPNGRMIAFGGTELTGTVNDTWILPLVGAPALAPGLPTGTPPTPRLSHSAVYDPIFERMIVFSGDDGSVFPIDDLAWSLGF